MSIYGLIGRSLGHSFSQKYFTAKFKEMQGHQHEYRNFEMDTLEAQLPLLKQLAGLSGLNVTIPYKTAIIPFLNEITEDCREINACNCIKIVGGKWIGYNTDVVGFKKSFTPHLKPNHKRALILGTGGASKAVAFVLKNLGIGFLFVSRSKNSSGAIIHYDDITPEIFSNHQIIINTTPVGMFPNVDEYPPLPYNEIDGSYYFFDLIYNPTTTIFLAEAEKKGAIIQNGEPMLQIQAEEGWRIWVEK